MNVLVLLTLLATASGLKETRGDSANVRRSLREVKQQAQRFLEMISELDDDEEGEGEVLPEGGGDAGDFTEGEIEKLPEAGEPDLLPEGILAAYTEGNPGTIGNWYQVMASDEVLQQHAIVSRRSA